MLYYKVTNRVTNRVYHQCLIILKRTKGHRYVTVTLRYHYVYLFLFTNKLCCKNHTVKHSFKDSNTILRL